MAFWTGMGLIGVVLDCLPGVTERRVVIAFIKSPKDETKVLTIRRRA